MEAAAYRASADDEPVLEARERDLPPAVRARLQRATEQGEALAWSHPLASWRPWLWLPLWLGPAPLGALLVSWLFGSLEAGREFALGLTALGLWALGGGALTARSWWLWRRGSLAPGWYLFASGLLEVSRGRLRLWPAREARLAQRGTDVTLDLGARGQLRLVTSRSSVEVALAGAREHLAQVLAAGDDPGQVWHEPLALDPARTGWRPAAGPARLPDERRRRWPLALAGLAALAAVGSFDRAHRWSDREGIRKAQRGSDQGPLWQYVVSSGPLVDEADLALAGLIVQSNDDLLRLDYLTQETPHHREAARQMVDAALARVLAPGEPPRWVRRWQMSDASPAVVYPRIDRSPGLYPDGVAALDVSRERRELQRYHRARPGRRAAIQEQDHRLALLAQADAPCDHQAPLPPPEPTSDAFRAELQAVLVPYFFLRRGERCQSLADLTRARDQAGPTALRAEAQEALQRRLDALKGEAHQGLATGLLAGPTDRFSRRLSRSYSGRSFELSAPAPWLVDLLDHLAAHADRPLRVPHATGGPRALCLQREPGPDWRPLVQLVIPAGERPLAPDPPLDFPDNPTPAEHLSSLASQIARWLPPDLVCADTPPAGPALTLRPLTPAPARDGWPVEVTLTLPGEPTRRQTMTL